MLGSRRVQDSSPLTPGAQGLFFAGNGANLLAPAFGGQGLPVGCLGNASCGTDGFAPCCQQRGYSYLAGLSVTYSGLLNRMIELEAMAFPEGRTCTKPNSSTNTSLTSCLDLWRVRRAGNEASIPALLQVMPGSNSSAYPNGTRYLLKSLSPDGEKHGVFTPRGPCAVDSPCPPLTRHGYFETSPNADAVALRVVDDALAAELYSSMDSVQGLNPCGFTLPNFPDYDDACGDCDGGFGTWVSGGSWSTLEGRVILSHLSQRRFDLAEVSMSRVVYPYASLFKLDNPIAHQGCGPGMYSQVGARGGNNTGPLLDVDIFAIPAAFLKGLFGYEFGSSALTLRPRLPESIANLNQKHPVFWGGSQLFISITRVSGTGGAAEVVLSVKVNGTACSTCVATDGSLVRLDWNDAMGPGTSTTISITVGVRAATSSSSSSSWSETVLDRHGDSSIGLIDTWH